MSRFPLVILISLFLLPCSLTAQKVTYSDYERENSQDLNFEIIGKMNGNFLVYKQLRNNHKLNIFNNDMTLKEKVDLDFIPDKTFNIDFFVYPDFFYMIYQYQKKSTLHCMGVKMDGNGKAIGEPVELDTTHISFFADNKIYTAISSEDKQKLMLFKIQKNNNKIDLATVLLNDQMKVLDRGRVTMDFYERKDNYGDFLLDNEGNLVFTMDSKPGNRDYSNVLTLITKGAMEDTFSFHPVELNKKYFDEAKLKVDNLNGRYFINAFYYSKNKASIEGLFTYAWDKNNKQQFYSSFTQFSDSLRQEAKSDGQLRYSFNDFFIRQALVKKDGGFLLTAEDYSSQTRGNNNSWNRWDYLNSPYSNYYNNYYYYNRYNGYYRPFGSYNNQQSTRYFYSNIMLLSIDKTGRLEWSKVIHKDQHDDDNDNFLSYSIVNMGGEVHFLFNDDSRYQIISDNSIAADGTLKRNATLKGQEKGYEFMTKLSKQVGARQLIIPCSYRGFICFAKIDF